MSHQTSDVEQITWYIVLGEYIRDYNALYIIFFPDLSSERVKTKERLKWKTKETKRDGRFNKRETGVHSRETEQECVRERDREGEREWGLEREERKRQHTRERGGDGEHER